MSRPRNSFALSMPHLLFQDLLSSGVYPPENVAEGHGKHQRELFQDRGKQMLQTSTFFPDKQNVSEGSGRCDTAWQPNLLGSTPNLFLRHLICITEAALHAAHAKAILAPLPCMDVAKCHFTCM